MKLKKIASLALAGIMAVSMFAGCAETNANSTTTPTPTPTPVSGASSVFAAELNPLASVKITMADDNNLQTALNAAAGNIGSATIIDFTNAVRAAGHVWGGVRTIANFDANYNVYIADVNAGDAIVSPFPGWDLVTNVPAGDLGVVADDMNALDADTAFQNLIPGFQEVGTETVTMLFAVDGVVNQTAAVRQVAKVLDSSIGALRIDDDTSAEAIGGVDATTLHYSYNGSVAVTNRGLDDNHGMSLNIIAVQITRTAKA